jgi:hypothetical protein
MVSDFINDIIAGLEAINGEGHIGDREWTIAIKKRLIDIAEKYSLSVNCNIYGEKYKHNDGREWLYDLIIYSSNNGYFDEVYLVCESEWSLDFDAIKWDFEKLLVARSKVHLLVYKGSPEKHDEYKDDFIAEIEKSGSCSNGDVYLFAIYNTSDDSFFVEKYVKK